jgi:hypothetical protein
MPDFYLNYKVINILTLKLIRLSNFGATASKLEEKE